MREGTATGSARNPWRTKGPNRAITIMAVHNQHNAPDDCAIQAGGERHLQVTILIDINKDWHTVTMVTVAYPAWCPGPPLSFNSRLMSGRGIWVRNDRGRGSECTSCVKQRVAGWQIRRGVGVGGWHLLPHIHYLKTSATGIWLKPVKDPTPAYVGEEPGHRKYYQRRDKCTL